MFSRTTIASSINKPTHSDKAIRVIMFRVKPNMYMNKKVPMMAIGKVRPVMTVERHELRNKNTINTVSKAPSIRVWRTLFTATRMLRAPSLTGSKRTPAGKVAAISLTAWFRPSTTPMVFSSWAFCTDISKVRWPLYKAKLSTSWPASCTWATWRKYTGPLALRATMTAPKSSGRRRRASICTTRSCWAERTVPSGRLWFSERTALTTWSADTPRASMAWGLSKRLISRLVPPTRLTEPTPRTFSKRFFRV